MFLHLGQNIIVPEASVIGVFDMDNTTGSHITRKFLAKAEKMGNIVSTSDELPRSFVVCAQPGDITIYLTPLSSQTLQKRFGTMPNSLHS